MVLVDSKQNQNYTATVRKVSGIIPIENFDRLVYAQVGVEKVLVSKDMIQKDSIVVFVPQEAALSDKYLKINNLYITYELKTTMGNAPQKIAVGTDFQWCDERVNIEDQYPMFKTYVADPALSNWWK